MISKNLIRVGEVSAVSTSLSAVQVVMADKDNMVSGWLPVVIPPIKITEPVEIELPEVGNRVLCLFLGNGLETGYCLGKVAGT